ncbi:MAG: 30S ribosomal protein S20 [Deltaproteobacteria bacterium]|nr:30S ribosomal protein S20 [Deltaproteobacteria bacterium]
MAHHKSALKAIRQNQKRRIRNRMFRTKSASAVKKVLAAISDGNKDSAKSALLAAESVLDKTARKGIIPKGRASRTISRLARKVNSI